MKLAAIGAKVTHTEIWVAASLLILVVAEGCDRRRRQIAVAQTATVGDADPCLEPGTYTLPDQWAPQQGAHGWYYLDPSHRPLRYDASRNRWAAVDDQSWIDRAALRVGDSSGLVVRWVTSCSSIVSLKISIRYKTSNWATAKLQAVVEARRATGTSTFALHSLTLSPAGPQDVSVPLELALTRGSWVQLRVEKASAGLSPDVEYQIVLRSSPTAIDPPTIFLTSPIDGELYCHSEPVPLKAQAKDPDGLIESVEFLADGFPASPLTREPYAADWRPPNPGEYVIQARALDRQGLTTLSEPARIRVVPIDECQVGPLQLSSNRRHFVDQHGRPFLWTGDTQWPLFSGFTAAEAIQILRNRRAKGHNAIQVMAIWPGWDEGSPPAPYPSGQPNRSGQFPLIQADAARPNDRYWDAVEPILEVANRLGMVIAWVLISGHDYVSPNTCQGGPGTQIVNENNARQFGRYFGRRFADRPNIVWVLGGDALLCGKASVYREIYAGLRDGGATQPVIFHPSQDWPRYGGTTVDPRWNPWGPKEDVLAAWTIQTGVHVDAIVPLTREAYAATPNKPVIVMEGAYERSVHDSDKVSSPVSAWMVRQQAWLTLLSGGFFTYGHDLLWRRAPGWQAALDDPGAEQTGLTRAVLARLDWPNLEPHAELLVAAYVPGLVPAVASRSRDGTWAMVYLPQPGAVTLDLSQLNSASIGARWVDPRNGLSLPAGSFSNREVAFFGVPPGWEDALLVLQPSGAERARESGSARRPQGGTR